MEKQSEHIPLTLTAAYEELQINDTSIPDKDVGVAYLQARRLPVERPTAVAPFYHSTYLRSFDRRNSCHATI